MGESSERFEFQGHQVSQGEIDAMMTMSDELLNEIRQESGNPLSLWAAYIISERNLDRAVEAVERTVEDV